MVLTGQQAYNKLKKAHELIKQVETANVIDCDADYQLLIASRSSLIRFASSTVMSTYDAIRAKNDGTVMIWNKS